MAQRNRRYKRNRKTRKLEPANLTMSFKTPDIDSGGGVGLFMIDLSQAASILNRRFYRQGLSWMVAGIKILTQDVTGSVIVQKLPDSWVMNNAWTKSYHIWKKMIDDVVDDIEMESIKGRFLDFKIYADSQHHSDGYDANLRPSTLSTDFSTVLTAGAGEWTPSTIAIPASDSSSVTDFELIAVGGNDPGPGSSGLNAKSIVQGYADSRALPYEQDPNVPVDASLNWQAALFNEGTLQSNAVINDLEGNGDQAPYPYEGDGTNLDTMYVGGETNMPALQIHDYEFITGTTIGGTTRLKGGQFQCGLMKFIVENTSDVSGNILIQLDLVPGPHRGYMAVPMQDV